MQRDDSGKAVLAIELVDYYDRFVEFHDVCAFYCDAVACLAAEGDGMDPDTARGLRRQSEWLKLRFRRLKEDLKHIQEKVSHSPTD